MQSGALTLGTFDANGQPVKSTGAVHLKNLGGDLGIQVSVSDVRRASDLSDYEGELRLNATVRVTDRVSILPGDHYGTATMVDVGFGPSVPCTPNADATVGSDCEITTSVDALIAGSPLQPGYRSIVEFSRIDVYDGGADGDGDTAGDNSPFLTQGVFVP